ncbi:MAG: UDP-N-acetylmuramoyl-tripeptide--D-alanyl-D-alanine ligase [Treponema sp.]|jgi:UDP-N-acetylmuramoyl-tripeptide--D-alanyl-D-alanine ligase|nr:UDP-N-acetylmuramoyl-tripeptide--D-alanyl-D-alanine ligase [Treponema sp.]
MDRDLLLRYAQLSAAFGWRILSYNFREDGGFSSLCIDSREAGPGALFVALAGSAQDGHRFVGDAFKRGAAAAMVAESRLAGTVPDLGAEAEKAGAVLIAVPDTLKGLQDTARLYLEQFPALLKIGITGSSGKTTTKEIAAAMIGSERAVVYNSGNLNSETGLPLSVFQVRPFHQAGIFEMGMNRKGEIAELAAVLKPHIALITNIGSAHIGILGSKEAIVEEKKQIFCQFTGKETALIPADDEWRDELARSVPGSVLFFGPAYLEELGSVLDRGLEGAEITWEGVSAHFALPGRYNLRNALAAAAIAKAAGMGGRAIRRGLEEAKPLFGRSEILRGTLRRGRGTVTMIRDCYNSNPDSAAEAVAFCDGLAWPGRKIYVLGSMLELGDASAAAHEGIGLRLAASEADMVFLYGRETAPAASVLGAAEGQKVPCYYTDIMGNLAGALAAFVRDGDLVLLKGSRICALEQLTEVLVSLELPEEVMGGVR